MSKIQVDGSEGGWMLATGLRGGANRQSTEEAERGSRRHTGIRIEDQGRGKCQIIRTLAGAGDVILLMRPELTYQNCITATRVK